MRKIVSAVIVAVLMAGLPGLALADAAGSAKGVAPDASAAAKGATRTLVVGSDIFIGDKVETGPQGNVQILFADNTKLVVGPGSSLVIEDYLVRNNGSAGQMAVNMLAGSFRFATGDSAKDRYRIDTPTGTIGVRGTGFDVYVGPDGVTRILLYRGVVRFCTTDGDCKDLRDFCTLGEIGDAETAILGDPRDLTAALRDLLRGQFVYADNQSMLLHEFWMGNARDCTIKRPPEPENEKPAPRFDLK